MESISHRIKFIADNEGIKITQLESKIGASKGVLSRSLANNTDIQSKWATSIVENYPRYNAEWLLTGKGEILKTIATKPVAVVSDEGIPLVEIEAVGGFGSGNFAINQSDILGRYLIPDFDQASFMLRVRGDSMSPRYSSGDLVACRVLRESQFIQWNEVHVIATREQGILIKRLRKGSSKETLLAVSENSDYSPFEIPQNEITGIALVLGGVRLE
jgi:phage repressor protein C with HTH and peptisase S24 domain